jgi:hypothetical protein
MLSSLEVQVVAVAFDLASICTTIFVGVRVIRLMWVCRPKRRRGR